jgi:AcrR family transcriptional regulator
MRTRMDPEQRRLLILDTAMAIVSEEGFKGLSLRAVARRCDMSAPGLMHYYPDMPTLLMALLQRRDEVDTVALGDRIADATDLRTLLDRVVDYNAEHPGPAQMYAMVQAEALDPNHPARAYFESRTSRWSRSVGDLLGSDAVPVELRRILPAVLDGLQMHWLMDPEGFDLRAEWALAADALLARYPSGRVASPAR